MKIVLPFTLFCPSEWSDCLRSHCHLGWAGLAPVGGSLCSFRVREEDPDEAVGKLVHGLGSLLDVRVKGDILAVEENPVKWALTISLRSSYECRDRWREGLGFEF